MTEDNEYRLRGIPLVKVILENIHESLKWMWLIFMSLALAKAVETYAGALNISSTNTPFEIASSLASIESLVLLSYLLLFIRFFFGDSRHLDLGYKETQFYHGLMHEIEKYGGLYRFSDIWLLTTQGIFFYLLALNTGSLTHFLSFFSLLLAVNICWLFTQFLISYRSGRHSSEILIGGQNRYTPLLKWIGNNFLCFIAIAILLAKGSEGAKQLALAITYVNSIVDYVWAWKYYFPDLKKMCEGDCKVTNRT